MVPSGPQVTDADDSIVLADLVRTGDLPPSLAGAF